MWQCYNNINVNEVLVPYCAQGFHALFTRDFQQLAWAALTGLNIANFVLSR